MIETLLQRQLEELIMIRQLLEKIERQEQF